MSNFEIFCSSKHHVALNAKVMSQGVKEVGAGTVREPLAFHKCHAGMNCRFGAIHGLSWMVF